MGVQKDDMIRVQVARRTRAALQEIADARCRPVSNLCYFILERERRGRLQLSTPRPASTPVSPDPRGVRINIRCERHLKESVRRQARSSGQSLSEYCNHLFERFTATKLAA